MAVLVQRATTMRPDLQGKCYCTIVLADGLSSTTPSSDGVERTRVMQSPRRRLPHQVNADLCCLRFDRMPSEHWDLVKTLS